MINANKGRQYTFNGFEVTKANRKAFDLAVQFAKCETEKPLAIFGGIACGKTHLLYAVKNAIEQNTPEIQDVITTTSEMQSSLENILKIPWLSHRRGSQSFTIIIKVADNLCDKR